VIISRRSHEAIVALYEARLAEQKERYESRLAESLDERDFYRNAWLERLGVRYPVPKPAEVTAVAPSAPVVVPDELTLRKTFQIERGDWSMDDNEFFEDYWVKPKLEEGVPREELDYWYYQEFGSQKPITVFLDRHFPVE
jgi:hypothetical protein